MQRTKIEWVKNPDGSQGYSWNPIRGICKMGCSYCYARRIYKRFKWNTAIRFDKKELLAPYKLKKPSRIFVCSTHEIFGKWIKGSWIKKIIKVVKENPIHTFMFLTKIPSGYYLFEFPVNCWLGITITGVNDRHHWAYLENPNIMFLSIEPLLKLICPAFKEVKKFKWIIIGGLTPKPVHKKEWIYLIVEEAKKYNIPIYIKDNAKYNKIIKEFPI